MSDKSSQEIPGIGSENTEKILTVFKRRPEISRVILYGSRAKGTYKNGSDIDLAVEGVSLGLQEILRIEDEIDDLLLPWKFDICLLHQIENDGLVDHIKRAGLVLFAV